MSQVAIDRLKAQFGDAIRDTQSQHGDEIVTIDAARVLDVMRFLRDDAELAFAQLIDVTCLDTIGLEPRAHGKRFEVVYQLRSLATGKRLRVKAPVDDGPNGELPEVDSVLPLWKGANWFEREAYDMFGVRFRGHPDLRRILMYEEFVGHPLRKDYPKEKRQPLVRRDFSE